jgi:hypothetical protein
LSSAVSWFDSDSLWSFFWNHIGELLSFIKERSNLSTHSKKKTWRWSVPFEKQTNDQHPSELTRKSVYVLLQASKYEQYSKQKILKLYSTKVMPINHNISCKDIIVFLNLRHYINLKNVLKNWVHILMFDR